MNILPEVPPSAEIVAADSKLHWMTCVCELLSSKTDGRETLLLL